MALSVLNAILITGMLVGGGAQAPAADALSRARAAYNAGKFDAAIEAATDAMKTTPNANVAAMILGRAHLERFRTSRKDSDLQDARTALRQVVPDQLTPRDRVEYLIGLGVSLYLDGCTPGCFSAAAEMFALALARAEIGTDREQAFEWWAGSLDQLAQVSQDEDRINVYRRLLDGAAAELARDDRSASATYWMLAAARGIGDLERAWGAAIAGWVRSRGLGKRGETLRLDLDRFVTQVLLPERARKAAPDTDARPALAMYVSEWEEIKKKYS